MPKVICFVAGALGVLGLAGCQPAGGTKAAPAKGAVPAKITGAPKEAELATVTLTPEAETRLGVVTVAIERKPAPKTETYAGEVMIPPGRLTAVTSPFVGMIKAPAGGVLPLPGVEVKEGQPVCVLIPILSPEAQATMAPLLIEADGQVKQATEQLKNAKVNLDLAQSLVDQKLGGTAAVINAKSQYDLMQTSLRVAEARKEILTKVAADAKSGMMNVQPIAAPASGVLMNMHAQAGQVVGAGAPLFEVAAHDPLWVKVAVFVGDKSKLATDKPAEIGGLADAPGAPGARPGKPVHAPPAADPLAATLHVFYEIDNKDGAFRPGERVGVILPMKGESTSLVAPRASLLRDIHGGTWVYEKIGDHSYARRRVQVNRVIGEIAVLATGPAVGAKVVTDGAAEIFGTEFGNTK